eukprot:gnl/TRDRNA2_/TRDRNA2_178834_c0_seq1.p2 gnl/TRDRNA2_/TRDRNA2_178834_c0~~gnl/TRDRNA2_/TRDRNA2_178834_c0_seq1.p2  ORF type:complete len:150 (-),score=27.95 gnl/TRDRNA2_/TRDRNA2_178834_c0_seq1:171-620(-)
MSVLAAIARRPLTATPRNLAQLSGRRALGDGVRGPLLTDIPAQTRFAKEFFTKGAISYHEYKQQCISLRLFVVPILTLGLAFSLFWNPPRSSWWMTWGPSYWFSSLKNSVFSSSAPIFLAGKVEREVNACDVAKQFITNRRLDTTGDEE